MAGVPCMYVEGGSQGTTPKLLLSLLHTRLGGADLSSTPDTLGQSSPQQLGQLPQCRLCSEVSETVAAPWCQEDRRALSSRLLPTSPPHSSSGLIGGCSAQVREGVPPALMSKGAPGTHGTTADVRWGVGSPLGLCPPLLTGASEFGTSDPPGGRGGN